MVRTKTAPKENGRDSGVELLKLIGILLIVLNHIIQTLHTPSSYVPYRDYVIDISRATTNIKYVILAMLRYSGVVGNTIFFVSSAWYLLDSNKTNKKKILHMIMDVWFISVITLIAVYTRKHGNLDKKMITQQLFPITYNTNWYVTCYLLFYPMHRFLNMIIKKIEQKSLLKITLAMLFLHTVVNIYEYGHYFTNYLILWVAIYFAIGYIKFYMTGMSDNIRSNIKLVLIGFVCTYGGIILTNYIGLHYKPYSNQLLKWAWNCNPFIIMMVIGLLNLARNMHFKSRVINYLSGLSLLIYLIHENALFRTFYRPKLWHYVYVRFGHSNVILWTFVLTLVVFLYGLIGSIIYKYTVQKLVTKICDWSYPKLAKIYGKIEKAIFKIK